MFEEKKIFRVRKVNNKNYWVINEWRDYTIDQGKYGIIEYKYKNGYQLFDSKEEAEKAAAEANAREAIEAFVGQEDGSYDPKAFKNYFKGSIEQWIRKVR